MKLTVNFGHGPLNSGGNDPGAVAPDGFQESTETREVGSKVVAKLKANSWDVLAIQDGDLNDVTNQSNKYNPDYFLSIHANSYADPSAHGVETYALAPGGKGEAIAKEIQKELVLATGLTDRGVKFANDWVLKYTIGYPSVLVEIGFISNPAEEALMKQDSWDDKVASAICRGFSRAVGVAYADGGVTTIVQAPEPSRGSTPSNPTVTPYKFTYPNNAKVVGDDLFIRDANGSIIPGRYVSNGDGITVLDVGYTRQLALVEYPTPAGVRKGYVANVVSCIQYYNQNQWHNGSTTETVYDENGGVLGSLNPREAATPLYRKNGKLHVVYATSKGANTKSGYVAWDGGFSQF